MRSKSTLEGTNSRITETGDRISEVEDRMVVINIQQVKEQDKCPPNQAKEEEIGSLAEKEFRIMIVKLIQNLENKMELQINRLETRIEKIQKCLTRT